MLKILFVCHSNYCRSPMAEFIFRDMVERRGLSSQVIVASAATSMEEIGKSVHPGTRQVLDRLGISCADKRAVRMECRDYQEYDYLIGMDTHNIREMKRITGGDPNHKIYRLLDFTEEPRDIEDPWYTGDFEQTYRDVERGCEALLAYLERESI